MRVRCCCILMLVPREQVHFELDVLLQGGDGLRRERAWLALAPHRDEEVPLGAAARKLHGRISPGVWMGLDELTVELATADAVAPTASHVRTLQAALQNSCL